MSEENFLSKILEAVETLNLLEGEYLEACNLLKECHKKKDRWISETKTFEKRFGADLYNKKGLSISFTLKKVFFWKLNNQDGVFTKKPDDIYTFELSLKDNVKTITKTQDELFTFIESIANMHFIDRFDILVEDTITISKEMYEYIKSTKQHLRKIAVLNSPDEEEDEEDEELYMDEDNFYTNIAFLVKKIFTTSIHF
jgi:hypothetical protein